MICQVTILKDEALVIRMTGVTNRGDKLYDMVLHNMDKN